jgi:hypothetical protein
MPYHVEKVAGGFKVAGPHGAKYSKHPQSKAKASAQIRAIAASESRSGAFHEGASHR